MTVTISLPPDLENRLREQAEKAGVDTESYMLQALETGLRRKRVVPRLSSGRMRLLSDINAGLSPETWSHYRKLTRKQKNGILSVAELRDLASLIDQIEQANAKRLKCVIDYANEKGIPVQDVLKEFDIGELADV